MDEDKPSRQRRNTPATIERARALRRAMTDAELALWAAIRRNQIGGAAFRKQVPIGSYVADFACLILKLVIEVDGGQHNERQDKDAERTAWLEQKGYRVLRFWNNDVLGNLPGMLFEIANAVQERSR